MYDYITPVSKVSAFSILVFFDFRVFESLFMCLNKDVCVCVRALIQLCLTVCDPMDCSLPSSSVHGILQAKILEWVAIPFSGESSQSKDRTQVSCIASEFFIVWATWKDCLNKDNIV